MKTNTYMLFFLIAITASFTLTGCKHALPDGEATIKVVAARQTPCLGKVESIDMWSQELGKWLSVDICLPADYPADSTRYPVLYMHDGQNTLDSTTTWNHQEWGVDEAIAQLSTEGIQPPIVVAVYCDEDRSKDYMPAHPHCKAYLRFLCQTLKPYIDSAYSTLPDREHTALMGSSMGALVSVYAAAYCPEYFGCCMGLSYPSVKQMWWMEKMTLRQNTDTLTRLYIDTGDAGLDAEFFPHFNEIEPILRANGYTDHTLMVQLFPGEDHNETCWSKRVAIPIRFAFE